MKNIEEVTEQKQRKKRLEGTLIVVQPIHNPFAIVKGETYTIAVYDGFCERERITNVTQENFPRTLTEIGIRYDFEADYDEIIYIYPNLKFIVVNGIKVRL